MKTLCLQTAIAAACAFAAASAYAVRATAQAAIAVDCRSGEMRAAPPAQIGYSPSWSGITNGDAYVVIEKIDNPDDSGATPATLATLTAGAEGGYPYAPGVGDERRVRLVHRVYSAGGAEIGEPLVRDICFGWRGGSLTDTFADTRANSLQEAVATSARARSPVQLTYSTLWPTSGVPANVTLSARKLSGDGGAVTATVPFFSAEAVAEDEAPLKRVGSGWMRLVCRVADADDTTLLEYVTRDILIKDFATTIIVR